MAQNGSNAESMETNNVVLFRTTVTNYFKSIAESVSEDEFINTMTILKSNPSVAKKLHKAMEKQLYDSMCADFNDILAEGSLTNGLAKVAKLVDEASNLPEEIAWRPPGDVNLHLEKADAQKILEESDNLEKQVEQIEAENARLIKQIYEKRVTVRLIEEQVNRTSKVWPGAIPRVEKAIKQVQEMSESLDTQSGESSFNLRDPSMICVQEWRNSIPLKK